MRSGMLAVAIFVLLTGGVQGEETSQDELLCLNSNPSFEADPVGHIESPAGWTWEGKGQDTKVMADSPPGEYGTRCLELDLRQRDASQIVWFFWSDLIAIDSKQTYRQSGWLKTEGKTQDGFGVSIVRRFYDRDQKELRAPDGVWYLARGCGADRWTYFSQTVVPARHPNKRPCEGDEIPADARYVRVGGSAYAYPKRAWFDGLRFERFRPTAGLPNTGDDKITQVVSASQPVTIDGRLEEAVWKNPRHWSAGFKRTLCPEAKAVPAGADHQTRFKVAMDNETVYFAVACRAVDSRRILVKRFNRNDVSIFSEEVVELFLDPTGRKTAYLHLGVNPAGSVYAELCGRSVDLDVRATAAVTSTGWQAEIAIPRKQFWLLAHDLGLSFDQHLWNLNVVRNHPAGGEDRYTSWSYTGDASFHNVQTLGLLLLSDPQSILIDRWSAADSYLQKLLAKSALMLQPQSSQPAAVTTAQKALTDMTTSEKDVLEVVRNAPRVSLASLAKLLPESARATTVFSDTLARLEKMTFEIPPDRKEAGYLIYQTPLFERPNPERVPLQEEIGTTVRLRLAGSEYGPATFSLFTKTDLKDVAITWTELTGKDNGRIANKDVDVRIVEPWGKNGWADILATDLRVKFVGWLSNYAALPRFIPSLAANSSRKLWYRVHVPDGQPSGLYQGTITVKPANRPATVIGVEVQVLPFTLEETTRDVGFYYNGILRKDPVPLGSRECLFWAGLTTPESCLREFKALRSAGFNILVPLCFAQGALDPGYCRELLTLARKAGFERIILQGASSVIPIGFPKNEKEKKQLEEDKKTLAKRLSEVDRIAKNLGFKELYFYALDEPHTPEHMERTRTITQVAHTVGVKTAAAFVYEEWHKPFRGALDVPILHWMSMTTNRSELRELLSQGKPIPVTKAFYYANLEAQYTPVVRLAFGWYLYKSGFQGNMPWTYYFAYLKWEPFDVEETFPYGTPYYVFPTKDDPLPTLKFEAAREGVTDLRYLEMVQNALRRAKDVSRAEKHRVALNEMLAQISLTNEKAEQSGNYTLPPERLEAFRQRLQDILMDLR